MFIPENFVWKKTNLCGVLNISWRDKICRCESFREQENTEKKKMGQSRQLDAIYM